MNKISEIKITIQENIQNNNIEKVFAFLNEKIENSSQLKDSITSIESRYNNLFDKINKGIISTEDENLERNKIINSLINISNSIKKEDIKNDFIKERLTEIINEEIKIEESNKEKIIEYYQNVNSPNNPNSFNTHKSKFSELIDDILSEIQSFTNSIGITSEKSTIKESDNSIEFKISADLLNIYTFLNSNIGNSTLPVIVVAIIDNFPPQKGKHKKRNIFQIKSDTWLNNNELIYSFEGEIKLSKNNFINIIVNEFKKEYSLKIPHCRFCNTKIFDNFENIKYLEFPSKKLNRRRSVGEILDKDSIYAEICGNCDFNRRYDNFEDTIHDNWESISKAIIECNRKMYFQKLFDFNEKQIEYDIELFQKKYAYQFDSYINIVFFKFFRESIRSKKLHYFITISSELNFPKFNNYAFPKVNKTVKPYNQYFTKYFYDYCEKWVKDKFNINFEHPLLLIKIRIGTLLIYSFLSTNNENLKLLQSKYLKSS